MSKLNLVILGGGNGPHCYAGIAAQQPDVDVRVLTLFQDEAERWTNAMKDAPFEVTFNNWETGNNKVFSGKPRIVSKDPAQVLPGAHLIVFMVPAFAHNQYFAAIEPYLQEGVIICGAPGACGFMFQAMHALGAKAKTCCLMSFESLPWSCRMTQFGRTATVLAGKDTMSGGAMGDMTRKSVIGKNPVDTFEHTLLSRPHLIIKGHLLGDTLMYVNAFIHPNIEYGTWRDWDGKPLDEPVDFYHTCSKLAAKMVGATSDEALAIRDAIKKARPEINLSQVIHMHEWYCTTFPDVDIGDKTDLYTTFRTHKGYTGIKHPMVKTDDGKYVPDFKYRYFTEDIPCGQVVLRGIAEILGVPTPNLDEVITWAQGKLGKEYLVNGKLAGKDIGETRCPQRFGISTLDGILGQ